jgi:thiol:disulfide interchange protein
LVFFSFADINDTHQQATTATKEPYKHSTQVTTATTATIETQQPQQPQQHSNTATQQATTAEQASNHSNTRQHTTPYGRISTFPCRLLQQSWCSSPLSILMTPTSKQPQQGTMQPQQASHHRNTANAAPKQPQQASNHSKIASTQLHQSHQKAHNHGNTASKHQPQLLIWVWCFSLSLFPFLFFFF